ncbi:hypothetical protein AG1IA_04743 [Rhizoctonia solani AG-1 IA]|uniref:Uncharacterized protein n=1 Tax=Thanatephorus cucumeris (strain AG1-IA) TaxID=983506 RepID=L8WWL6_THACA|nr:hypothetical protein AG1IA_04743 [Rhizoctonia solani AG-1 IA]
MWNGSRTEGPDLNPVSGRTATMTCKLAVNDLRVREPERQTLTFGWVIEFSAFLFAMPGWGAADEIGRIKPDKYGVGRGAHVWGSSGAVRRQNPNIVTGYLFLVMIERVDDVEIAGFAGDPGTRTARARKHGMMANRRWSASTISDPGKVAGGRRGMSEWACSNNLTDNTTGEAWLGVR